MGDRPSGEVLPGILVAGGKGPEVGGQFPGDRGYFVGWQELHGGSSCRGVGECGVVWQLEGSVVSRGNSLTKSHEDLMV